MRGLRGYLISLEHQPDTVEQTVVTTSRILLRLRGYLS